jgi:hypothetical protein
MTHESTTKPVTIELLSGKRKEIKAEVTDWIESDGRQYSTILYKRELYRCKTDEFGDKYFARVNG